MTQHIEQFLTSPAARPKVGRPKLGTSQQRVEHLLDYAMQVLIAHGFRKSSISQIAQAAGVSTRTIYEKYQNKGELMLATVEHMVERDVSEMQSIERLNELPLKEALHLLGCKILSRVLDPSLISLFRMGVSEAMYYPEIAEKMKRIGPMRIQSVIGTYLQLQISKGIMPTIDVERSATLFCEMLISEPRTLSLFGTLPKDWMLTQHVQFVVQVFLTGINGLKD
jgi:AcrR family transcriptional regulator